MPNRPLIALAAFTLLAGCSRSHGPSTAILNADAYKLDTPNTTVVEPTRPIAPAVQQTITPVPALPATAQAATRSAAPSQGEYVTLGGVVARVNGKPIFSDEVLSLAAPKLEKQSLMKTSEQFAPIAFATLRDALGGLIRDELEVAAAERSLRPDEQKIATRLTEQWRDAQITGAGGSLELAMQKARDDGQNFNDLVEQQHRELLRQIYYQKKIFPRVQVTVDEVRRYYDQHLKDQFTVPAKLEFKVIKLAAAGAGSKEAAMAKAADLRSRIGSPADFAKAAAETNDDPLLKKSGGDLGLGLVDRGAYRYPALEDAAFALKPGQTSQPVAADGDAYLVELVRKQGGEVVPFEEVQDKIQRELQVRQMAALQQQQREQLEKEASVQQYPEMIRATFDLAMLRYVGTAQR